MKVDRSGNLREVLDIPSEMSESASASDGGNYAGGVSSEVREDKRGYVDFMCRFG